MALLLPHSVFIHVPKTGGSWVREAIRRSGIRTSELQCNWHAGTWDKPEAAGLQVKEGHGCWHNGFRDVDADNRLTFAFVRHPVSYYVSYWSYRHMQGWEQGRGMDAFFRGDSFDAFIDSVMEHAHKKGWLYSMYKLLLTRDGKSVDFIGKQESLADDLVRALRLAGEEFDEQKLRSTPMENIAGRSSGIVLTDHQRAKISSYEQEVILRYGYDRHDPFPVWSSGIRRLRERVASFASVF